eukprot:85737_1
MSASIELYNNYLCDLLIHGYSHKHCQVSIDRDICSVCSKYIYIPSNLLPLEDDYKMTEVNYLLFNYGFVSGRWDHTVSSTDKLKLARFNKSYAEFGRRIGIPFMHDTLCQIIDQKLLNAMTLCVDWNTPSLQAYESRYYSVVYSYRAILKYKEYDKYLNIAIDLSKKGIGLRCKYMSKLIAMYEYYYFDLYVLKFIKQTLNAEDSTELINLLQMRINDELNGNQGIDFDEWSNYNSMKMSSLTQIIIMEHEQNVDHLMCELDNILSFVRFKYKMIRARITKAVGVEREAFIPSKTVVQIISHVVLGTLVVSWVIPTAPICIVGANCYKYMSNDPRDEIELFDNLAKYIYPWVPPNERVLDAWLP